MNQPVRISHPELLLFSKWTSSGIVEEGSGRVFSWKSDDMDTPTLISCIGSFDSVRSFNAIYVNAHPDFPEFFPDTFRFEISHDGHVWEPILQESDFRIAGNEKASWNFPLITARHIKFLLLVDRSGPQEKYFSAFGEFRAMISGIVEIETSSELDRLWVKENIVDERPEYGWSSSLRIKKQEEYIRLDLGSINSVGELRMLSKDDRETFFPEVFRVSYSEDNIAWHHLLEENGFLAENGTWYRWRFLSTNMRYVRITIDDGARTREGKFISQIIELELYATPDIIDDPGRTASPEPVPYSSVLRSGIVRLARDGEVREGVVIQGSDRRLKEATTETKGIVELASDGEDRPGLAVQGHDRRLKLATEDIAGIVRLARNGEVRAGHAIQSNDSRLKGATQQEAGLVELAEDGESRPGVAVQGNDRRLKNATVSAPGLVTLAENGSDKPGLAVQGNDHRLRAATSEYPGIMRFARSGEENAETAVQGSDPRIKPATTELRGIVELARDGEDREGVVVQGSDIRLKYASPEKPGIVELSAHGETLPGRAVQADDPRLSDARKPTQHTHEYAPVSHDFNSHTGILRIEESTGEPYSGLVDPPLHHAPVSVVNSGGGAGLAGKGREGVVGSGSEAGVIGFSMKAGTGILGASREGSGGKFISEKGYGLVAGGSLNEKELHSSDLAALFRGISWFQKSVVLAEESEGESCLACYFTLDGKDVMVPGDIVVTTAKEGILQKSRDAGSTSVVGVVVSRAALVLSPPEGLMPEENKGPGFAGLSKPAGMELVAVAGIVHVRAIADKHPIQPGDVLVTSLQTGRAQKYSGETYKPGMVFAKSLGELKKGEGLLRAILLGG